MTLTQKRVGIMIEPLHGYGPRILDGVVRWVQSNPDWKATFFDGEKAELARLAREWSGDGIICTIVDEEFLKAVESRDIPVVNVAGRASDFSGSNVRSVLSDDEACGRMAAQYLIDRGYENFAVSGSDARFSAKRENGFRAELKQQGYGAKSVEHALGDEAELSEWLLQQARPLAVYCSSDRRGASFLEAAYLAKLRVPEDLAVLGTGDHVHLCELCSPRLSSVDCDMERRGYEAAELLNQLMAGLEISGGMSGVPPAGVVTRSSTDCYTFDDTALVKALRFIRENAHLSIKVSDVVKAAGVSRRSLENRFSREFRHSVHEEIWNVHFKLAKQLLITTDHDLKTVASMSGFSSASGLVNCFKERTGLTPRTYRAENRR